MLAQKSTRLTGPGDPSVLGAYPDLQAQRGRAGPPSRASTTRNAGLTPASKKEAYALRVRPSSSGLMKTASQPFVADGRGPTRPDGRLADLVLSRERFRGVHLLDLLVGYSRTRTPTGPRGFKVRQLGAVRLVSALLGPALGASGVASEPSYSQSVLLRLRIVFCVRAVGDHPCMRPA